MAWAHFFGSNSHCLRKRDISFQMKILMIGILEQNHTLLKTLKRSVISTQQSYAGIERRLAYTDISESPCAFSEAPAEGIFSVYKNITNGRESLTIEHAVALACIAVHGPPPATADSAKLADAAMKNFKSKLGERFCNLLWKPGYTSKTLKNLHNKVWYVTTLCS